MENLKSLRKAVEEMDNSEEHQKHNKEEETVEETVKEETVKRETESKIEEEKREPSPRPQMSGRKMRKILKRLLRYTPLARAGRGGCRGKRGYRRRGGYRGGGEINISGCTIYGGIRN
ncbi:uncharacterized protein LOC105663973 [Megachile rotundata]|uniref:uncharacterized protein LOC105663973 n=1 Tax=Megachile rotundata TaxID=143995 RepID=UPI003FD0E0C2